MVALNVTLTAINAFYIVRLLRGRHDSHIFEVVEISPNEAYLKHLLHDFNADIQHFNPGFSSDDAAQTDLGSLIPRWAWSWRETQGTDQRRSTSITSCPGIRALPWVSSSTVPVVRSPRGATEE